MSDTWRSHPSAHIDSNVKIGAGTRIWHGAHIMSGAVIGEDCTLGQNVFVGKDVVIGNGCKIQNNVSVFQGVTLEDRVFVGPSAVFTNVINPRADIPHMDELRPTLVKEGASIGANATIICGVTLGRRCLVGAGAVVTRDIAAHAMAVGVPAESCGYVCRCGVRLEDRGWEDEYWRHVCPACGAVYWWVTNTGGLEAAV